MTWEDAVKAAGKRYADAEQATLVRRETWEDCAVQALRPVLSSAATLFAGAAQQTATFGERTDDFGLPSVELTLSGAQTSLGRATAAGERSELLEGPAVLSYALGYNGLIGRFERTHALYLSTDPPAAPPLTALSTHEPTALTAELVQQHLVEFLDRAFASSFLSRKAA